MRSTKIKGLYINLLCYIFAFIIGFIPFCLVDSMLFAGLLYTLTATLVIYLLSLILKDTSLYDPYWSVEPLIIVLICMVKYSLYTINTIIVVILVGFWSLRLTFNWIYTYKGIGNEDFRYASYRKKYNKVVFQFINFFGFMLTPTLIVYGSLIPALTIMESPNFYEFSIIGIIIAFVGIMIEYISDKQIHIFKSDKTHNGRTCNIGLWKYSRHPNYLGENLFWFGLMLMTLLSDYLFAASCVFYITMPLLFIIISIPLMEEHNLEKRKDYKDYISKTHVFFILPNKK